MPFDYRFLPFFLDNYRFLPTKSNRRRENIDQEIRCSLHRLIEISGKNRVDSKYLLGMMLSGDKAGSEFRMEADEIIDKCRTFYFAGKENTANLLIWAVLLLSLRQEWQDKAREEVLQVCSKNEHPNADDLINLKIASPVSL